MVRKLKFSKLKAGLIGIGKQSIEDHIPAFKDSSKAELIAIQDTDLKVVKEGSFKLGIPGYTSLAEMLKKHKIDFAIVAVPHDQYLEIVRQLAEKRIHILKEKPVALNIKEAIAIRDLIRNSHVELMVTLQRRFNPIFTTFLQLMKQIGQHFYIEAKYSMFVENPAEGWRGEKKRAGGGCIIDMGYHSIDLLIWYFGLPDQIHAELRTAAKPMSYYDAEDTAAILFRYSDRNLFGILQLSRFIPPKTDYLKLVGTNGIVEVKRGELVRYQSDGEIVEKLIRDKKWTAAATTQIDYFCDVINGLKPNIGNVEYHLQHMAFIEACYRSQKIGKFVNPFDILHQYD